MSLPFAPKNPAEISPFPPDIAQELGGLAAQTHPDLIPIAVERVNTIANHVGQKPLPEQINYRDEVYKITAAMAAAMVVSQSLLIGLVAGNVMGLNSAAKLSTIKAAYKERHQQEAVLLEVRTKLWLSGHGDSGATGDSPS